MNKNLMQASEQWSRRPQDERFDSLDSLYEYTKGEAEASDEFTLPYNAITIGNDGNELYLRDTSDNVAYLNNWSYSQLCQRVKAPSGYISSLPIELAAKCLNHGVAVREENKPVLYCHEGEDRLTARAFTSERYERIFNHEIVERLFDLRDQGWKVPPARPAGPDAPGTRFATAEDVLDNRGNGLSVQVGDPISPAGLYASDRDMFCFMVYENNVIDDGSEGGLGRGFFVENSEVGSSAFKMTMFYYRFICGNHIVWDAEKIQEIKIRHIGNIRERFGDFNIQVRSFIEDRSGGIESMIVHTQNKEIAATKEQVLDVVFQSGLLGKNKAEQVYDIAEKNEDQDGSPRSYWGYAQGITRLSQKETNMNVRSSLDRSAGQLLAMSGA